jgi:hypothetical protein
VKHIYSRELKNRENEEKLEFLYLLELLVVKENYGSVYTGKED